MPRHVRKGDTVIVTAGAAKRTQGRILKVIPDRHLVVVEGVNIHKKHLRPSRDNPQGGIIEKEMPIHISNVSPAVDGKPTRVRFEKRPDGSKVRIAVRTGEPFGQELKKARS